MDTIEKAKALLQLRIAAGTSANGIWSEWPSGDPSGTFFVKKDRIPICTTSVTPVEAKMLALYIASMHNVIPAICDELLIKDVEINKLKSELRDSHAIKVLRDSHAIKVVEHSAEKVIETMKKQSQIGKKSSKKKVVNDEGKPAVAVL